MDTINFYQDLKEKALAEIAYLKTNDRALVDRINAATSSQIMAMTPKIFVDGHPDNCIVQTETAFETLCINLEELGVQNPKRLSVFEFYSKIRYFKQKKRPN